MCRNTELNTPVETIPSCDAHNDTSTPNKQSTLTPINDPQFPYPTNPDLSFLTEDISSAFIIDINTLQLQLSLPASPAAPEDLDLDAFPGPPPCCSDTATLLLDEAVDPECSTCKTKPLPDPSESTTLCAQAFVLISQQNFRNLDPGTIRMWLAQGLRRAQREGEGCRVENGALLRLLDYISGM
jgi:hypothetical protein